MNKNVVNIVLFNAIAMLTLLWFSSTRGVPIYPSVVVVTSLLLIVDFLALWRRGDRRERNSRTNNLRMLMLGKFMAIVFTANVFLQVILFIMEPNARTFSQIFVAALLAGLFWALVYRETHPPNDRANQM
jgi:hypothetical protein